MFTGIVEAVGVLELTGKVARVVHPLGDLEMGSSIAVNGVCLTVTSSDGDAFTADLSEETLARTSLSRIASPSHVNLERPMPADGRFGGHVVQGHVDGIGRVENVKQLDGSTEVEISIPLDLSVQCVAKGSVTLDGVSLTVAALTDIGITVALIPHTLDVTILSEWRQGTIVNIETDIIAKYVSRLLSDATPRD